MRLALFALGVPALIAGVAAYTFWGLTPKDMSNVATSAFSEPSPITEEFIEETTILGKGHPDDPCTVEIHTAVLPELEKIGVHKWLAACEIAVANQANSDL